MAKPVELRHGQRGYLAGDGYVVVMGQCTQSGKDYTTGRISIDGLLAWSNGAYIQDALPELSKEDREFLISGTSPEGWLKLFPHGDDDPPAGSDTDSLEDLNELEDEDLEAIVRTAATGGNEIAQREAREALAILETRHPSDERSYSDIVRDGMDF